MCDLLLVSHLTAASFRRPPGLGLGGLRPQSTVRFRLSPSSFAEPAPLHPRFFQNRQPTPSTSRIPTPSTFVFNCVCYLLPFALHLIFFLHSGPWIAPLFAPCLPSPPTKALTTRHPPRHPLTAPMTAPMTATHHGRRHRRRHRRHLCIFAHRFARRNLRFCSGSALVALLNW